MNMNKSRIKEMAYASGQIKMAGDADKRNDAATRKHIVSTLRGDSELPKKSLDRMLKNAGLVK